MTDQLTIPDSAISYILFQRTAYLRFPVAPVYRLLNRLLPFPTPLYNIVVAIEARLRAAQVKALYAADMQREYATFRHVLPQRCAAVLDIGCGVAGIDVLLQRHYAAQPLDFYLLDKTELARRVFYLFNARGAFYNSLPVARNLLRANGIADQRVHLVEANAANTIRIERPIDLALSLLSWGFHYPVQTYVERVYELLRDDGVLILDVRRATDGRAVLQRRFADVAVIHTTAKYERLVARKA